LLQTKPTYLVIQQIVILSALLAGLAVGAGIAVGKTRLAHLPWNQINGIKKYQE
jgi:hypothetical protein